MMRDLSFRKLWRQLKWQVCKRVLRKEEMLRKVQDNWMYLDLKNEGISKVLAINGIREADHTEIVKTELKKRMAVLDIGANIGYYPLIEASIVGHSGKVYAIEPDPRNTKLLRKNVLINEYQDIIEVHNTAMSNKPGRENMFVSKQTNLNTLVSKEDQKFLSEHLINETIEVSTTTVDKFLENRGARIDFIRMDIEGYEVEVLEAMEETVKGAELGFKVLFELHPQTYSEEHSLAKMLEKLFHIGLKTKIIISAGMARPKKFAEMGYKPIKVIYTEGFYRGWYEDVRGEDVIELTCYLPKISRYIMLEKM